MHSVLGLRDSAERTWRDTARTEFPVFADMPVKSADPDPKKDRHWQFYTNNQEIHTDIFRPDIVQSLFENVVLPLYRTAYGAGITDDPALTRRLIHDVLTYLHCHETLHPAVTPDSKEDEEQFDLALRNGILKAEPHISKPDLVHKLGNVRNAGWDIVIDDVFFHNSSNGNNLERRLQQVLTEKARKNDLDLPACGEMPDGVVPVFDVMEIHQAVAKKEPFRSLFYPITRLMYGLLFTRQADMRKKLVEYFTTALKPSIRSTELRDAVTKALKGIVSELSASQLGLSRVDKMQYEQAVEQLYDRYGDPAIDTQHRYVIEMFTHIMSDKRTRYAAIRGFIQPLSKYISLEREEKRHGTHITEGDGQDSQSSQNQAGGNMQQALQNLANVLDPKEASDLLAAVANDPSGSLGGKGLREQKLQLLATDEYYKRNAKGIKIRSPRQEAVRLDLGKRQVWERVETNYLAAEQLHNLPLEKILQWQSQTGITSLFQLSEHEWRYDIYELRETQEFDFTMENVGLELPRNLVFHLDSSGSMGSADYVGKNTPYDRLMHVVYGILKTLATAAVQMKQDVNTLAANFSNGTLVCDKPADIKHVYETPFNDTKKILLGFQGGVTTYSMDAFPKIKKMLAPGKTVHVWITDGGLDSQCAGPAYSAIEQLAQNPDTTFLYFEIGHSAFGERIKQLAAQRPNVKHYPVDSLDKIQSATLEVVLQYDDKRRFGVGP